MSEDKRTIEIDNPTPRRLVHLGLILADKGSLPVVIPMETIKKIIEK